MSRFADSLKQLLFLLPEPIVKPLRKARAVSVLRSFSIDEEPDLRVVRHLVNRGDTVVDVGANIGCYTHLLSRWVGPTGRVHSIEPVPLTFEILAAAIAKLELVNVELHNCAASERAGRAAMEVPAYESGGKNFYQARIVGDAPRSPQNFEVEVSTVDAIVGAASSRVSFVKIDVEGMELPCLTGARELLARAQPALLIEVSSSPDDGASSTHRLFELLGGQGYAAYWYDGRALRRRRSGDCSVNYFFLRDAHLRELEGRVALVS